MYNCGECPPGAAQYVSRKLHDYQQNATATKMMLPHLLFPFRVWLKIRLMDKWINDGMSEGIK